MVSVAFVILHYLTIEDTKECVESIQRYMNGENYHIIIVDNASANQTGKQLCKYYSQNTKMTVLLNKKNLGFAAGNNVGFKYAKENLNPEYIVLMNNDICMTEDNFYQKTKKCFEKSDFAVMGPMVLTADGRCDSNPMRERALSYEDIVRSLKLQKRRLFFMKHHIYILHRIYMKAYQCLNKKKTTPQKHWGDYIKGAENLPLHGCFMVFSRKYINQFDGLDERTFLYGEEDVLYYQMQRHHLKMVYHPEIRVFHKEDSSTNAFTVTNKEKRYFICENMIHSLEILKELYKM